MWFLHAGMWVLEDGPSIVHVSFVGLTSRMADLIQAGLLVLYRPDYGPD